MDGVDRYRNEEFRNFRMTRVSERMREGVVSPVEGEELCTIQADETLDRAANKMFQNKVGSLTVVHPETEEPVGTPRRWIWRACAGSSPSASSS